MQQFFFNRIQPRLFLGVLTLWSISDWTLNRWWAASTYHWFYFSRTVVSDALHSFYMLEFFTAITFIYFFDIISICIFNKALSEVIDFVISDESLVLLNYFVSWDIFNFCIQIVIVFRNLGIKLVNGKLLFLILFEFL